MIRHIVFFSARNAEDAAAIRAGLSLLTENPHKIRLEIGSNLKGDQWSGEPDFIVYGEFEDEAQLAAYKAHPLYQRSIDLVRPIRDMRIAADYVVEQAATTSLIDPA